MILMMSPEVRLGISLFVSYGMIFVVGALVGILVGKGGKL